jgi:hypothetical protein
LLITRPSTTIYQAVAMGVPMVHFPTGGEDIVEFAEPLGAYETAQSGEQLVELVKAALAAPADWRDHSRAFLERHVDVDPAKPSIERIADALLEQTAA